MSRTYDDMSAQRRGPMVLDVPVDSIYQHPGESLPIHGNEINLGDLHANAMLLMYALVSHHILQLSTNDYDRLAAIYCTELIFPRFSGHASL